MEGLAALSKYAGCDYNWKNIREKYQLRWANSEQENLRFFTNYMTGKGNFDEWSNGWIMLGLNFQVMQQMFLCLIL